MPQIVVVLKTRRTIKHIFELIDRTREEKGNISYTLYADQEHPGEHVLIEEWEDQTSLDAHFNMRQMSYADGNYNMTEIFNNTLLQRRPQNAITFVDNHDSQPGQSLESFVNTWMKQVAYAMILLHKDGVPCVFYGNLYGIPCTRNIPIPRLRTLIRVRHDYAYGEQHDYIDDYDIIGWTREGDEDHPHSGIAVLLSDKRDGAKRMYIGKQFAGKCFRDCMRKVREVVTIDDEGYGYFTVQGFSSAVWVTEEVYEYLVINED